MKISDCYKISRIIKSLGIKYCLFHNTLFFTSIFSRLSDDKNEYFLLNSSLIEDVKKIFKSKNYYVIKKKNILILKKKQNQFHLIFINKRKKFYFKGVKYISKEFSKFKKISVKKKIFYLPKNDKKIISDSFAPTKKDLFVNNIIDTDLNIFEKFLNFIKFFTCLVISRGSFSKYQFKIYYDLFQDMSIIEFIRKILNKIFQKENKKITNLSEENFRSLTFDSNYNTEKFRKKHLSMLCGKKNNKKIGQIVEYLKRNEDKLKKRIIEVNTKKIFNEPVEWNKKLWSSGNNFYIYSAIYGFKRNVISYKNINRYILENKGPPIFSKKYYQNLDDMDNNEIKELLRKEPIYISKKGFLSGRHRVSAMIGRLAKNKSYFPIKVIKIN